LDAGSLLYVNPSAIDATPLVKQKLGLWKKPLLACLIPATAV
jgi:hypothetical protein